MNASPGWFGKIASLGDFASRRLPQQLVAHCDAWLAKCMQFSREQLGERWLDTYLAAPLWRFEWQPGAVALNRWHGILMPSVDRVGRYYPLVIAQTFECQPEREQLDHWFEHLAHAGASTLHAHASVEQFETALALAPAIASDDTALTTGNTCWWQDGQSARDPPRFAAAGLPAPQRFVAFLER